MAEKVYQVPLRKKHEFTVEVPEDMTILSLQTLRGFPFLFVVADAEAKMVERNFYSVGSGETLPVIKGKQLKYTGTYPSHEGKFIWNVYMEAGY